MSRQRTLGRHGGLHGSDRTAEDEEEGIPRRADLDSTVLRGGFADDRIVVVEYGFVSFTELVQERCGALDIGEYEGDGPRRQRCHASIVSMRFCRAEVGGEHERRTRGATDVF